MATTSEAPSANPFTCSSNPAPPYTVRVWWPRLAASGSRTSATWIASSRVGTITRARGRFGEPCSSRSISGSPKASVLPEPVLALPHTSRPAMASGMVSSWMGKGCSMPSAARTSTRSSGTPRSAKVVMGAHMVPHQRHRAPFGHPVDLDSASGAADPAVDALDALAVRAVRRDRLRDPGTRRPAAVTTRHHGRVPPETASNEPTARAAPGRPASSATSP